MSNSSSQQRLLEEDISCLERHTQDLNFRRNAYIFSAKIPEEILLEIFKIRERPYKVKTWHHIAHVCRDWRRIALNAPVLWCMPPTELHEYTIAMLERSKRAPLHILIDGKISATTIASIMSNVDRVQTFDAVFNPEYYMFLTQALLLQSGKTTSKLENFCLYGTSRLPLSVSFFAQPNVLRELSLFHVDFDWKMLDSFPNLTKLILADSNEQEGNCAETLLAAVSQMTRLEHLTLSLYNVVTPDVERVSSLRLRDIKLSCLRCLVIDSKLFPAHFLLAHLDLPQLNQLLLRCRRRDDMDQVAQSATMQTILATIANGSFENFETLELNRDRILSVNPVLSFSFEFPSDLSITQFMTGINTSSLSAIEIGSMTDTLSAKYFADLGSLPLLESITVYGNDQACKLTKALSITHHAPSFTNLKSITWRAVSCTEDPALPINFYECLLKRYNCGVGILDFSLENCRCDFRCNMLDNFAEIEVEFADDFWARM